MKIVGRLGSMWRILNGLLLLDGDTIAAIESLAMEQFKGKDITSDVVGMTVVGLLLLLD